MKPLISERQTCLIRIELLRCEDGLLVPHVWAHQAPGLWSIATPASSADWDMPDMKYWHNRMAKPERRSGVGLPRGPFAPHYNGSISWFSPLWAAAAATMSQGRRPASCQAVSTPFSATLWPTPPSALRLHCAEESFCPGQIDVLMRDTFRPGLGLACFLSLC